MMQCQIISLLKEHDSLTAKQIRTMLGRQESTVWRMLGQLEKYGLVSHEIAEIRTGKHDWNRPVKVYHAL